jgi:hypothetical protein
MVLLLLLPERDQLMLLLLNLLASIVGLCVADEGHPSQSPGAHVEALVALDHHEEFNEIKILIILVLNQRFPFN